MFTLFRLMHNLTGFVVQTAMSLGQLYFFQIHLSVYLTYYETSIITGEHTKQFSFSFLLSEDQNSFIV
jgi:hypothetical protein